MALPVANCAGPISRRGFLRIGGAGALGLSELLRNRAISAEAKKIAEPDTAVIFVWLPGGPPHMETYDLKPNAPEEYRGIFKPIPTVVPGLDVCEYLPRHAQIADKFNIIRSVAHEFADHGGGHKRFLTGRLPATPTEFVNDAPMVGSIVSKLREGRDVGLPNYVAGVDAGRGGVDTFSFGAAYLGPSTTPFMIEGNPNAPDFRVSNLELAHGLSNRLNDRTKLLHAFDQMRADVEKTSSLHAHDAFNRKALGLLTSARAREAFDLSREDPRLRDRYGRHPWGQRAILARRLVEV